MKTTLIRFIITLYLLGNSYVLKSMDHFFIGTITKFQIGELNCGNFNDKYRKIVSNGCFLLNERGERVKHGVWVFYNQETKLIDSINFENGKIVGVRKIFNSKGRLLTLIDYQNKEYPRNFKETQFFNSGASRKIIINYIQLKNDSSFKHGAIDIY